MTATIHVAPEPSPFGVGEAFEVVIPQDVRTYHGNLVVSAGHYMVWQSDFSDDGINFWSPDHYARGDRGGNWVSLPAYRFHLPGEAPRGLPEHDCLEEAASGVAGGVYCGICMRTLD
jgi:hypothetical protein